MREITVPSGFFRFGMAYSADQLTARLRAIMAVSEVRSVHDGAASLSLWLTHSNHPLVIGYGSRSGAEHDRRELMAALHDDYEAAGRAALNEARDAG